MQKIKYEENTTCRILISINGIDVPWENLSIEKQTEVGYQLNKRVIDILSDLLSSDSTYHT